MITKVDVCPVTPPEPLNVQAPDGVIVIIFVVILTVIVPVVALVAAVVPALLAKGIIPLKSDEGTVPATNVPIVVNDDVTIAEFKVVPVNVDAVGRV